MHKQHGNTGSFHGMAVHTYIAMPQNVQCNKCIKLCLQNILSTYVGISMHMYIFMNNNIRSYMYVHMYVDMLAHTYLHTHMNTH